MTERAFTILELLAVIVIVTLLGTLAGLSLRGAAAQASIDDIVEQIEAYDAGARVYAARFGRPVILVFDDQTIEQQESNEQGVESPREPLRLPSQYSLTLIGDMTETGELSISVEGRSWSYAIEVTGASGLRRCVVIAGLTGRTTFAESAEQAQAILEIERQADVQWDEEMLHDAG